MRNTNFSGFLGNEGVVRALDGSVKSGRVPHAILLSGQQGCGKFTLAVIFAKNILCSGLNDKDSARIVHLIDQNTHPDVSVVHKNERGLIAVDAVRHVGENLYQAPNEGEKKIIIIKDAQNMNEQAQNALLKMLEEPPEHVVFILTCSRVGALLPTVFSRVCHYELTSPLQDESAQYVKKLGFDQEQVAFAAQMFDGNIQKMVEYCKGENQEELLIAKEVLEALCDDLPASLLSALQQVKNRQQMAQVILQIRWVMATAAQKGLFDRIKISRLRVDQIESVLDAAEAALAVNCNLNLNTVWLAGALFDTRKTKK